MDEAQTPEEDNESLNQSLSSPGCLSGLSSLQSPSTSLASPINLLASPSTPNPLIMHHDVVASNLMEMNIRRGGGDKPLSENFNHFHVSPRTTTAMDSENGASPGLQPKNSLFAKQNGAALSNGLRPASASDSRIPKNSNSVNCSSNSLNSSLSSGPGALDPNRPSPKSSNGDVLIKTEPIDVQHQQQAQQNHLHQQHRSLFDYERLPIVRNPVGANPRDINNPLSVNQLTKRDYYCHNTANFLALNINHALAAAAVQAQAQQQPPASFSSPVTSTTTTAAQQSTAPQSAGPYKSHHIAAAAAQAAQDLLMSHHHQSLAHNFHNLHAPFHYQLAAAAAAASNQPASVSQPGKANPTPGNSSHHRNDDGNAISVT